jgi:hypothetical protein
MLKACRLHFPHIISLQMQGLIRSDGSGHMSAEDHSKFVKLHSDGGLLPPEYPGHVIAALSVRASVSLTGQFVSWDEEKLKEYRGEEGA